MYILDELMNLFNIESVSQFTTFGEFFPWFCKLLIAVFIITTVIKCMFDATHKIGRGLKK